MTADDVLRQAIQGISDLILVPGLINLDFADVKTIMAGMGLAMMGTGIAEGENRAMDAARRAISSPLLEGASVQGARGVIINVTGGPDLSLLEVSEASTIIQEAAHEDANIIFGAVIDPQLQRPREDHRHRHRLRPPWRRGRPPATTRRPWTCALQHADRGRERRLPLAMVADDHAPAGDRRCRRRWRWPPAPRIRSSKGIDDPSPLDVPAFLRRQHEG